MGFMDEIKQRNFSIYGQWMGILAILLCIALGIANIFHFDLIILWSVICLVTGLFLIFLEIPLLLRICPTSKAFDTFVRKFSSNYTRAAVYLVLSIIQWTSLIRYATSLIAAAVILLLAGACYGLAGLKNQEFMNSKTLGGGGIAQMIV
ncbi:hypothetical protein AOL_s00210g20 [Orbilia oligospora ATCC 24927]|uniref:Golgi apparatus membrane protein tvp18 n=2 Tax=Orbilia oligospora TaxID=2813651 RepID=G1XRL2_ARTOA|nr:hypothetical protein AOL_s00210g20 [Orbilia oligospora ATCC 24927]EGX44231.1 hypothetical protein AOL_s00210g20 [Orbilia oligospora ATCC 24927]KAF3289871.1 Golgi apparatus membrane protein tvp18 [Orbilia oligospora]